jgi:heme/copper-type cytochrome/quinol oxidase subunit 1
MLPLINREVYLQRISRIQPYLYGLGVLIFSLGLFWAGSHGVPRKTAGVAQNLDSYGKIAGMGLMGIGGIIAILGGATFVINTIFSLLRRRKIEIARVEEETYGKEYSVNI